MKRALMIIAAISFLVPSFVSAQARELPTSKNLANGHYWVRLNEAGKVVFTNGVKHGIELFRAIVAKDSGAAKSMKTPNPKDITMFATKDLIKQIDLVYRDTTNTCIPLIVVYRYAVAKLSGESSERLEQMLDPWKKER